MVSESAVASPSYPSPSTAAASAIMRANRKVDTKAEIKIRSELHARGLRFRKHKRIEAGSVRVRPDVVFPRQRLAVFIDGCFWHGCPEHGTRPRSNTAYWNWKLAKNAARDELVSRELAFDGWAVIRVWEHVPTHQAADEIEARLHELAVIR